MCLVWNSLDQYRQAVILSHGQDVKIMCIAYTKIAKVYLKVMKDGISRSKGKDYLNSVMELSQVIGQERNLHSLEWFNLATEMMKEIQDSVKRKEDEEWSNKRKVFMQELKDELKLLNEKKNASHRDFIAFLFEKMPPKHRQEGEWRPLLVEGEEKGVWKKVIMKLCTIYHPDRVDKDVHTEKYHVLCEEVTKELTCRYNNLKEI